MIVDAPGDGHARNLDEATAAFPDTPIADEVLGTAMLYSSGTTGRPKGILRPLPEQPPAQKLPVYDAVMNFWRCREGMIFLSPAPLYHVAPHAGVAFTIHLGGTAIIMEHFDPEQFLRLVEQYQVTHTQLADDVLENAQTARGEPPPTRSVVARSGISRRSAVSGASKGADDRMVGADHF